MNEYLISQINLMPIERVRNINYKNIITGDANERLQIN